ncbi:hypothetical protein FA15DRAFT_675147 [Coprinopsis marcescibilis]|uniref:Nucleotidyltransferase n=1 Tax=Coprinopsis marcescibilis TaxID=230819 RepID=A0A5C3KS53_COPMA|nr:hypothetical protein FA15DRAFT_675147 [Coprinopsis marcescibilis]
MSAALSPTQELNKRIRTMASQVLFPLLKTLNVQAALIGNPGLALLYPGHPATKELVVAVNHHDPLLNFERLAAMISAKDPSHFSSPPMKNATMAFQAKEVPEIQSRCCMIQFMFIKDMVRFTIDLRRSSVAQTFPVMPAPWIFLTLLEEWATGGPKERGEWKTVTKKTIRALGVICAGGPDWVEFNVALASFPHARERLVMLEAADRVGTRTHVELIRRNTSISSSSSGPSGDTLQRSPQSTAPQKVPDAQSYSSILTHPTASHSLPSPVTSKVTNIPMAQSVPPPLIYSTTPPAFSSMPYIPPLSAGVPRVVDRSPDAIPTRYFASHSLPNKPSISTAASTAIGPVPRPIPVASAAYALLMRLDAWASSLETERSREALLSAWATFFKGKNWTEFNHALKWFPDANQQLDKFQAAFPLLSRKKFRRIRTNTTIASQQLKAGQDSVARQPTSAVTASRSVPVKVATRSPILPISVPPPPSKSISLANPRRDLVPSLPEPGTGPHDHTSTLVNIAWDVVNTLRESGLRCAFFGCMGCRLYGNKRLPEDLDVLVLPLPGTSPDREVIEKGMARNSQFFTTPVVDAARAHSLFRYIPPHMTLPPNFKKRFCKVDVVLPGPMNLPYLSEGQVNEVEGLPVVPVLVLLLHKLQGWEDRLKSAEMHKFRQHIANVEDIKDLLGRVGEMPVKMFRPWSERELLGEGFVDASKARVKRFCARFPETAIHWEGLGFEVA